MMFAMVLNFFAIAKPSADRIAEVIDEKSELSSPENAIETVADGSIDFENVTFSYTEQGEDILQNIDLHIASGETIGVIGGTGSAKSTLVSLIPRLYDVKQGCVKVGGEDVRKYDLEALRDNVAMVLQKNVLFSGSITENMRWGKEDATMPEIQAACAQAQATEFIDRLPGGYDYDLGQGGVNVSGGQKQRLCIARALLKNPKVIIFDDSTSAVDTKTDSLIRASLAEAAPDCTKIIIAQRISSVQEADRIIVMNDGKIAGIGTHEQLLKENEIYQDVYYSQVKGGEE
jgi:ATP-binding cassette subfamily B protein